MEKNPPQKSDDIYYFIHEINILSSKQFWQKNTSNDLTLYEKRSKKRVKRIK